MTPEELAAIQARADAATQWHGISHEARGNTCLNAWPCPTALLAKDGDTLLEALRESEAENARLKASNVWLRKGIVGIREYAIRENLAVPYQITTAALAAPSAEGGQA